MSVVICAILKDENHYLREWVEYHKSIGIDHIVLYDNNSIDGETVNDVIDDYIKENYVEVYDIRGEVSMQCAAYSRCYSICYKKFDWILYIDIDEFLVLEKHINIQDFVNDPLYKKFDCIRICWKQYTDSGLLDVENENYSVSRFTDYIPENCNYVSNQAKVLLRLDIRPCMKVTPHGALGEKGIRYCNTRGEKTTNANLVPNNTWDNACINHYRFKTIGEFVKNKMIKGWPHNYLNFGTNGLDLSLFFQYNQPTLKKKLYAEKIMESTTPYPLIYINSFRINENSDDDSLIPINFGDNMNYEFLPKILPYRIVPYLHKTMCENYIFIGSIIDEFHVNENSIIWGAGVKNPKHIDHLIKPKEIYAVRGPLTRQVLLDHNINCPEVYGDPLLLLPFYYNPIIEKKYRVGLIPHFRTSHKKLPEGIHIIKMNQYESWKDVVDDILSCEYIVSESLHGLILAEAYNIPNLWIDISLERKEHSSFKFHDFFLSIGQDRKKPYKVTSSTTENELLDELKEYSRVFNIDTDKLIQSCPLKIFI